MRRRFLIVISVTILLSMGVSAVAQSHLGIGVKWLAGEVPFVIGSIKSETIGIEGGIGLTTYGIEGMGASILWYLANGKLYFPVNDFPLSPYVGAGIAGVRVSVSYWGIEESANIMGLDGVGGLEFSALQYGIPLVLFVGIDYLWMSLGELETYGISFSSFSWHVGVRLEF